MNEDQVESNHQAILNNDYEPIRSYVAMLACCLYAVYWALLQTKRWYDAK